MIENRDNRHYQRMWTLIRPLAIFLSRLIFGFRAVEGDPQGPFFLVCNHLTDWDPVLVGSAFRKQMYFVASEHILRHGLISRILNYIFAPIARQKGGNAAGTVKGILRALRDGGNVALFPEGNRSWDGLTGAIPPATGKLAKSSGATLVTYRLRGGYLSSPRWAGGSIRKGRMSGRIVGVYPPEELKKMTAQEVNSLICRDLAEDAWEQQEKEPVRYRGKKPAEHLENYLFLCPECGKAHCLQSKGDIFRCTACGAKARYTDFGFLEGDFRFQTVREWAVWQEEKLKELIAKAGNGPIFSDDGLDLLEVTTAKRGNKLAVGRVTLYADRLELPGGIVLPTEQIGGLSIRGSSVLFIGTTEGKVYQLIPRGVCNTEKYVLACRSLGYIDIAV